MTDLSMKPSRDDLAERRPVRRPSGKKPDGGGGGMGTKVLVVVLFSMALAAAGYLWLKVQELNGALEQTIKASQEQLGSLESKVNTQDKSLSATGDKTTNSINQLNGEVRKLWDLASKRNRTDIDQLLKTVQAQQTRLDALDKARGELSAQLEASQGEVKNLKAKLQEQEGKADKLKALQDSVASLKTAQQALEDDQATLGKQQKELDAKLGKQAAAAAKPAASPDLGRRLSDVEADILSINASRQQVNSRLNQLDQDIQGLYQRK